MDSQLAELSEARTAEETHENTPDRLILQCLAANEVGDARLFNDLNDGLFVFTLQTAGMCGPVNVGGKTFATRQ